MPTPIPGRPGWYLASRTSRGDGTATYVVRNDRLDLRIAFTPPGPENTHTADVLAVAAQAAIDEER